MAKRANVKVNYLYNLSYQILTIIVPIVVTPYVSRVLQVDGVGTYSFCHSIISVFAIFAALGLDSYGQLAIAKHQNDKCETTKYFWEIFLSKGFTTIICLVIYILFSIMQQKYRTMFLTLSVVLFSTIFDISWFYKGKEQFKVIAIRNAIIKVVSILLIFVFIKKTSDLILYVIIVQGSTLLGNFSFWLHINKYVEFRCKLSITRVFIHIKSSILYFIPTIAASVFTILDKSMLGVLVGSEYQNGIYEQAHKIEQILASFVLSISQVLLPRMTFLHNNNNEEEYQYNLHKAIMFTGFLSVAMAAGIMAISDNFIPLFLGKGYEESSNVLKIFSALIVFSGTNTLIGNQCLVARGNQRKFTIGVVIGAAVNVALNALMIPWFYAIGAATASVLSEVCIFVVFMIYCRAFISIKGILFDWWKYLISGLIMCLSVYYVGKLSFPIIPLLIIQIFIGITIYFFLLLIFKDETILYGLNKLRELGSIRRNQK